MAVGTVGDQEHFAHHVYKWVRAAGGADYLDAIMRYAEEFGVEVEHVGSLVKRNAPLLQQLEAELVARRVLPSSSTALSLTSFMVDPS